MSIKICSLNSGSNGNCYYIGNEKGAVLIDAGISCRETETRMKRKGLSLTDVKAIFISHEHTDHISGVTGISKKYKIPVYITHKTRANSNLHISESLVHIFEPGLPVITGSFEITAFRKSHDASDPHSFIISDEGVNVGVFTDIGYPGKELIRHFKKCHAAFLESNYCEEMLENGSYPKYLKKRISGRKGHLSNTQALDLYLSHKPAYLSHLILSHLSENNNDPALVDRIFKPHAGNTRIIIASRYQETDVYEIAPGTHIVRSRTRKNTGQHQNQLSLF